MKKINLNDKFSLFDEHWSPKILTELNNQYVKIAKVNGEFVWHAHADEDELFFVVKGRLLIDVKDHETIDLGVGEMTVIPKKTQHRPYTQDGIETWIMLIEPKTTRHTGEVQNHLTNNEEKFI